MKRTSFNAVIDAAALVEFFCILTTGFLIYWRLPPGSGHSTTLWSLSRHEWGDVHFWIAMVFLATLLLHIWLHWKWIVAVVAGADKANRARRLRNGVLVLVALFALMSVPLLAPLTPIASAGEHDEGRRGEAVAPNEQATEEHGPQTLTGRMTFGEAADIAGVPVVTLAETLGLPPDVDPQSRLGPLAREWGVSMDTLRERIADVGSGEE